MRPALAPYWQTLDRLTIRLYHGHVLDVLRRLPKKAIHCVVTSPPYWGLRAYGTGPDEIGSEQSPEEYVQKMILVFREIRRVLRDDGTTWIIIGDTYFSSGNLTGIPWRVALSLQADGWILRQDIIWHKPSPMPESVSNRCTKAHEYIFLLTKGMDYYYDAIAIDEVGSPNRPWGTVDRSGQFDGESYNRHSSCGLAIPSQDKGGTRNKRDVWTIPPYGYSGAHFATFPPKLVEPCILAGTSERGCCARCGTPWDRIVESTKLKRKRPHDYVKRTGEEGTGNSCANSVAGVSNKTLGWKPTCYCGETHPVIPCTVLDPFIGSGTTGIVAIDLSRRCWGIDLSEQYLSKNAIPRIEGAILSRPALRHLLSSTPAAEVGEDVPEA